MATDDAGIDVISMLSRLYREVILFVLLFVILALGMHFKAWIDHPIAHLKSLPDSPLGIWHPFVLTAVVYILIGVVRWIVGGIRKMAGK